MPSTPIFASISTVSHPEFRGGAPRRLTLTKRTRPCTLPPFTRWQYRGDHQLRLLLIATVLAASLAAPVTAEIRPDQVRFRELYKELVETNTTLSAGSCTLAAERMAARLRAAGYNEGDIRLFGVADHPKENGLVATLNGTDSKAKAVLLLAHIDVVEAKREDWTRDPFLLVEENGYFYGRGSSDDKAHAAIFTDTLVRLKQAGTKLRRPLKLALTCGEETGEEFNGANWLVTEHKDWIDAQFALNEGSVGLRDASGKKLSLGIQAEEVYQDFRIEASNPGGHSSRPRPDNAIYSLAAALVRIGEYEFPVEFTDTTRAYFTETAKLSGGETGAAMMRLIANPNDLRSPRHCVERSDLSLDAAHDLRGDAAGWRPCRQRAAAAGRRRSGLPDFPRGPDRNVRAQLTSGGRPALTMPTGEIIPLRPAAADAAGLWLRQALRTKYFPACR